MIDQYNKDVKINIIGKVSRGKLLIYLNDSQRAVITETNDVSYLETISQEGDYILKLGFYGLHNTIYDIEINLTIMIENQIIKNFNYNRKNDSEQNQNTLEEYKFKIV